MRFSRSFCAPIAVLLLGSCARAERTGALSVVDGRARTVTLERPAQRIVSLAPATTELLFALGAGPRLVGRTRWCDYPAEAATVPDVGDGLSPNIEAIAATRPDLVVMYATPGNDRAVEQLAGLGIPAVNVPMDRLADVATSARLLGRLLGDSARADSIAAAFDSTLAARKPTAPPPGAITVAIIVWDNPPIVIGTGSFLNELVEMAGATNVFSDVASPSGTVSIETIAARNPAMIVIDTRDSVSRPSWASRPEWQVVPAVKARRFVALGGTEFGRPSLRAPAAADSLRAMLAARAR